MKIDMERFNNSNNSKSYIKDKLLIFALVLIGLAVIFSYGMDNVSAANSSNIYVNYTLGDDGWNGLSQHYISGITGPKRTIKNATGTVATNGTVHLADCTYNENNIQINRNMHIVGINQKNTLINGPKSGSPIFTIATGVNVTITNLTLKNAPTGYGGAIFNNGNLTINNCTFKNINASDNGGVIFNGGTLTVNYSTFTNNTANNGGAIYNSYATMTVNSSTFTNNTATTNGGAIYNIGGTSTINNSTFTNNTATNQYGGVIYNNGKLIVTNSKFINNTAIFGGGIYLDTGSSTNVNSSRFTNNTGYGGAIFNNEGSLTAYKTSFINNTSIYGGAIYNYGGSVSLDNCGFTNNTATATGGGAIYGFEGSLTVNNSSFTNNTAINAYGGAIWNYGNSVIKNSSFTNNTATYYGGAIYNLVSMTIDNSSFTNNTVTYQNGGGGGAIYNSGSLSVVTSSFTNNTAPYYGGAIYNVDGAGTVTVNFNRIIGNTASNGSSIYNSATKPVDATNNWWGSNKDPSVYIGGSYVSYNPWIVLTVTSNQSSINVGGKQTIIVDLLHDSNGVYHNPANGHVPDGFTVNFSSDTKGTVNPIISTITNGSINTTFTGLQSGVSEVLAVVDDQVVKTNVNINKISTTITVKTSPTSGLYNTTKTVTLTTNVPGKIYYTINGTTPTNTSKLYTGPLTIKSTTTLKYLAVDMMGNKSKIYTATYTIDKTAPKATVNVKSGLYNTTKTIKLSMNKKGTIYYTLNGSTPKINSKKYSGPITIKSTTTLKYLAVDLAGNKSHIYTNKYTIDKTAPKVVLTKPKKNSIDVSLTSSVTIKFSEKISKASKFSRIYIKNMTTGKITHTSTKLSGNTITIKMIHKRLSQNNYQIYIPKNAVKDTAGNSNKQYILKFKTSRY